MTDFDDEITAAAPRVTRGPDLDDALTDLLDRTRPPVRRRRWAVRATVGVVALGVLAGGAAAASTAIDWVPWLQEPDLSFEFQAPSGLECFGRVGDDARGEATPEQIAAMEDVIRNGDIVARAEKLVGGYLVPDPTQDPDRLYVFAFGEALSRAVLLEMMERGVQEIEWGFQIQCPGAQW
jgi:hypothetical protein